MLSILGDIYRGCNTNILRLESSQNPQVPCKFLGGCIEVGRYDWTCRRNQYGGCIGGLVPSLGTLAFCEGRIGSSGDAGSFGGENSTSNVVCSYIIFAIAFVVVSIFSFSPQCSWPIELSSKLLLIIVFGMLPWDTATPCYSSPAARPLPSPIGFAEDLSLATKIWKLSQNLKCKA